VWHPARFKRTALPEKLSSLRQKLYRKAKQEPGFRFYTLYGRVFGREVLECAYRIIRKKNKAAGVDGVTFEVIESTPNGAQNLVDTLHEELRTKRYKPLPVRRSYTEKPDGGQRPLGIPAIRDRVVQMATLLILEPIFEADFLDCSHGFRPERSAKEAMMQIKQNLREGRKSVYDADLAGYFDSIPHDKLMKALEVRIVDRSVLKLIRMWLKSPIVETDDRGKQSMHRSKSGTPQGGVISPLLANVYLHFFDKLFHARNGPVQWANARLVRYADDFVVMARYQGDRLQRFVEETLEKRFGLTLNRTKTRIVNMREPGATLDFLGFTLRYDRDLHGRNWTYLNIEPSRKALKRERDRIREMTHKSRCFVPLPDLVDQLSRQLNSWSQYYRFGYPRKAFRAMNHYARKKLIRHLRRRSQRPYRPPRNRSLYAHLADLGLRSL
jgi:RNA-directed DNA polymerase